MKVEILIPYDLSHIPKFDFKFSFIMILIIIVSATKRITRFKNVAILRLLNKVSLNLFSSQPLAFKWVLDCWIQFWNGLENPVFYLPRNEVNFILLYYILSKQISFLLWCRAKKLSRITFMLKQIMNGKIFLLARSVFTIFMNKYI